MKKLLSIGALLLFAATALAQQPGPPPNNPPPYTTPPTFPQEQKPAEPPKQRPAETMPPETKAPPPERMSSAEVQDQIQKKLTTEPLLANADVNAAVDAQSVVLTGTVDDEQQHDLALRIAESYAGERNIVDKVKLRQKK